MNEDVLWYVARVSGLMAWVLAYGALICGILIQSRSDDVSSPSRLWADDACRFFGFNCVLFAAIHGASIVMNPMFDVSPNALLTLSDGAAWLGTGLIVGVLSAWVLVVANLLRFVEARFASGPRLRTALTAVMLASSAVHGWLLGSDTQNLIVYVAVALAAVVALAAAGLAFSSRDDSLALYNETSSAMDAPIENQKATASQQHQQQRQQGPEQLKPAETHSDPGPSRAMVELKGLTFSTTIDEHEHRSSVHANGDQNGSQNSSSNGNGSSAEMGGAAEDFQVPEIEGARLIEDHGPDTM